MTQLVIVLLLVVGTAMAMEGLSPPGAMAMEGGGMAKEEGGKAMGGGGLRANKDPLPFRARDLQQTKAKMNLQPTCPDQYDAETQNTERGEEAYFCHPKAEPGFGTACPELQSKRIKIARDFFKKEASNFDAAAIKFNTDNGGIAPLFNKVGMVTGLEGYEEMDVYHIDCLMGAHLPDKQKDPAFDLMYKLEDKIELKGLAASTGTDMTGVFFFAHAAPDKEHPEDLRPGLKAYVESEFVDALEDACTNQLSGFMIKPTHLSWSAGIKAVKNWPAKCADPTKKAEAFEKLKTWVMKEILTQRNKPSDKHLELLAPGFTMETLFKTCDKCTGRPLEAKVNVLFGKVVQIQMVGNDHRDCEVPSGVWRIFGDGTGWDMAGVIGEGAGDEASKALMEKKSNGKSVFDKIVEISEAFVTKADDETGKGLAKADWTRVDLFIGDYIQNDLSKVKIELNEVENVSGIKYRESAKWIGDAWVNGYLAIQEAAEKVAGKPGVLTKKMYKSVIDSTQLKRDAFDLDLGHDTQPGQPNVCSVGAKTFEPEAAVVAAFDANADGQFDDADEEHVDDAEEEPMNLRSNLVVAAADVDGQFDDAD